MFGLPLAFSAPLLLTAFVALPLLWYLLRVVPPKPREVAFPPMRLLLGITPKEESAARTPWWLTALRLLLAALIILAAAGPILNPPAAAPSAGGPLVLVIDQGWPAAASWEARRSAAAALIDEAETNGRGVALIPTGDVPREATLLSPSAARDRLRSLEPVPYGPARRDALALVQRLLGNEPQAGIVFITDAVDLGADPDLARGFAALGGGGRLLVVGGGVAAPLALAGAENGADALTVKVLRPEGAGPRAGRVTAHDMRGLALGEAPFSLPDGATEAEARFDMPVEIRNEVARLEIAGERSAGAVQLLDKRWRRRAVGLVSGTSTDTGQPLLAPTYYLSRALGPYADLRVAETGSATENINRFLEQRLPVLVLTDVGTIPPATRTRLARFVEEGGVLVRFAGPRLANAQDDLLPVKLRRGGRVLGGSLSWETPQKLGALTAEGPFRDLHLPDDVTVTRQVLAEPDGTLGERTWATLADGTPLVTGVRRGKGALVLFHVTGDTSWSNLPLSGTFVEMLRRVIALSDAPPPAETAPADIAARAASRPDVAALPPARVLDGFGAFRPAGPTARAVPADYSGRSTADHPPGLYGPPDGLVAVNTLLPADRPKALDLTVLGGRVEPLQETAPRDMRGPVLAAAMALLLLDALAVLFLAGGLSRMGGPSGGPKVRRGAAAALLAAIALAAAGLAGAPAPARADDAFALKATLQTRFAYVVTGDSEVDEISRAGLDGLATFLGQRTALQAGEAMGVDIARDELAFFPLLYWPILPDASAPPPAVLARIDAYMKQGGTVIFDTRDAIESSGAPGAPLSPAGARLKDILSHLDIPELEPVPRDHVLTKAFYLLKDFPGRFTGGTTWVEALPAADADADRPARAGDGVSPVIISSNDLAGAWAVTRNGEPLLPLTPGEPRQREIAFRAGANMVMYVLTGNYKADQVHVPALLERLGQ
ncbi:DUF4159 domain-containing protein [Xanthobacter autotrophicus]|uniref:DUF4159 domain-containing protein n=1 Tax=Xanthobacter TaxID=279 RepID=UPI0024AB7AA3|nr:DUF4159 domain-containing protein [Xanthobacter autotrophicus]MDI4664328.1 DUF4159 domain-containing protein [Xanthobacter autotrophicus]